MDGSYLIKNNWEQFPQCLNTDVHNRMQIESCYNPDHIYAFAYDVVMSEMGKGEMFDLFLAIDGDFIEFSFAAKKNLNNIPGRYS